MLAKKLLMCVAQLIWVLLVDLHLSNIFVGAANLEKDKYTLQLSNTGPAVWGSKIKFHAQLFKPGSSAQPVDTKDFKYEWFNTLSGYKSVHGDFNASISECFKDDQNTSQGRVSYDMIVMVYDTEDRTPNRDRVVAKGDQTFYLTDDLNGKLNVSQKLSELVHPPPSNVYSTNVPVHVRLNLTDRFVDKPVIFYNWYLDDEFIRKTTDIASTNMTFNASGTYNLKVEARSEDLITCEDTKEKQGTFSQTLNLKDKAYILVVRGKTEVEVNSSVTLKTLVNGTAPLRLCWRIVPSASPGWVAIVNCSTLHDKEFELKFPAPDVGSYSVVFTLENDVSYVNRSHDLNVFDPYAEGRLGESVLLPVVCGVIAMAIVTIGLSYVFRKRLSLQKTVEVADFDFHPSISVEQEESTMSKIRRTLSSIFNRNTSLNDQLVPPRNYGSYSQTEAHVNA